MENGIKFSIKIADIDAKKSAYVVWRGFEEAIAKAKEYGYDGIELGLRQYEDVDFIKLGGFLSKYDMQVSSIGTGQVFSDLHLMLCDSDDSRRRKAIQVMKNLVDVAADYSGSINLSRVCGYCPEQVAQDFAMAQLLDSISILTDYANTKRVTVLIEPLNRYEGNLINTIGSAAKLLKWIPADNVGIMPDLFHMNIEEESICDSLLANREYVKYLHFADSNRHAPGMGHMDYPEIFETLFAMDYRGWISMDILPVPNSDQAAYHAIRYLSPFKEKYNSMKQKSAVNWREVSVL